LCGLQVKVLAILDQMSLRNIFGCTANMMLPLERAVRAYEEGKSFRQEEELKRLREISLVTPLQKGSGQSEKKCRSCRERTKNGKQLSLTMSTGILGRAWASTQGLIKLCSK
jgi:hypothetical protein